MLHDRRLGGDNLMAELAAKILMMIVAQSDEARAKLLTFHHLVRDPSAISVDLHVDDRGQVRLTLTGGGSPS